MRLVDNGIDPAPSIGPELGHRHVNAAESEPKARQAVHRRRDLGLLAGRHGEVLLDSVRHFEWEKAKEDVDAVVLSGASAVYEWEVDVVETAGAVGGVADLGVRGEEVHEGTAAMEADDVDF